MGTPTALTDDAGAVQWQASYTPFGQAMVEVGNVTQNIRFPGQYFDSETGLHYNYFRYYDAEIGRYVTSDPIGLAGGINTYGYIGGNPGNYVDPTGLEKWDWNGIGNTAVSKYYDKVAEENNGCGYFKKAALICRGEDFFVNQATNTAIAHAWMSYNTSKSQSEIYDSVRQKLVFYDKQMRQMNRINEDGRTCGDSVDFYHDQAFEESGLSPMFYGGNLWPQETWPTPVPYDPRNEEWKDDWFN